MDGGLDRACCGLRRPSLFLWTPDDRLDAAESPAALEFVTGYLIEEALSVDNLFVFLLIFRFFQVPSQFQHKVLFWGIIGALVMRLFFIFAGVALINRFHWIIYLFGALLFYAGFKLLKGTESAVDPADNSSSKLLASFCA